MKSKYKCSNAFGFYWRCLSFICGILGQQRDLWHGLNYRCIVSEKICLYLCSDVLYRIGHYNPSVRLIDLVSHTTYVVRVNFIHKWRDLQFNVDSEWQIFWEIFHGIFIYSLSFCQKSAERNLPKKYFHIFVLMSGLGLEPWLYI